MSKDLDEITKRHLNRLAHKEIKAKKLEFEKIMNSELLNSNNSLSTTNNDAVDVKIEELLLEPLKIEITNEQYALMTGNHEELQDDIKIELSTDEESIDGPRNHIFETETTIQKEIEPQQSSSTENTLEKSTILQQPALKTLFRNYTELFGEVTKLRYEVGRLNKQAEKQSKKLDQILNVLTGSDKSVNLNLQYLPIVDPEGVPYGELFKKLPVKSKEELEEVEVMLEEEAAKHLLVEMLKNTGGKNLQRITDATCRKCLEQNVGAQYSWHGLQGNLQFKTLHIAEVLIAAIQRSPCLQRDTTESEVVDAIRHWLRYASDQPKRRRKAYQESSTSNSAVFSRLNNSPVVPVTSMSPPPLRLVPNRPPPLLFVKSVPKTNEEILPPLPKLARFQAPRN